MKLIKLISTVVITCAYFTPPVAVIQMSAPNYLVGEGDGSVEICVELTSLPAGGLECEISVTLNFTDGVKAGKNFE